LDLGFGIWDLGFIERLAYSRVERLDADVKIQQSQVSWEDLIAILREGRGFRDFTSGTSGNYGPLFHEYENRLEVLRGAALR
jgi:hypothetical protein